VPLLIFLSIPGVRWVGGNLSKSLVWIFLQLERKARPFCFPDSEMSWRKMTALVEDYFRQLSEISCLIFCDLANRRSNQNILYKGELPIFCVVAQPLLLFMYHRRGQYGFAVMVPQRSWARRISYMRAAKRVNTTLGELIFAVTEEVAPLKTDRTTTNALVSYIVQDMFLRGCVQLKKKSHLREIVEMNAAA
jgi:hypothetical protein